MGQEWSISVAAKKTMWYILTKWLFTETFLFILEVNIWPDKQQDGRGRASNDWTSD